jgi:glycosyltransferase involved in cell wall biosynthesis
MPRVSVCVPVYNAEKTVLETLESVIAQTEQDWELIIQDNGSRDRSLAIIEEFAARHQGRNIRVIRKPTTSPAHENWLSCIREARAPWIKLLFADDLIYPRCLERQLAHVEANPGVVLVANRRDIITMSGRVLTRARGLGRLNGRFDRAQVVDEVLRLGSNPLGEPEAVLFSRAASESCPGFSEDNPYLVDLDYWIKILSRGHGFADPEVLGAFRVAEGSASIQLLRRQSALFVRFIRELQAGGLVPAGSGPIARATALSALLAGARAVVYLVLRIFR